jgi:glyoxylase-like metal-dependent hydrolase (beta-lactamase superfamily II)
MQRVTVKTLAFGCVHPRLKLPMNTVNVHLVDLDAGRLLVDSGPPWTGPVLAKELKRLGWTPHWLALTHSHIDHAGGAAAVSAAFPRMRVLADPEEWGILRKGEVLVPTVIYPWTRIRPVVNWAFTRIPMPACQPHGPLDELRRLGVTPVSSPGHSLPHTSLLLPDGQMILGDVVTVNLKGEPQVNCYLEDRQMLEESILSLASLAKGTLHPGHGPSCRPEALAALADRIRLQRGWSREPSQASADL